MATISTAHTIVTDLKADLRKIKVVRGYLTNMGERVFHGSYTWNEIQNRPSVCFWEEVITLIQEDRTIGVDNSQSRESLSVNIVTYTDVDDSYDMLHKTIKDIRVFLLSNDNSNLCYLEQDNITISPHAGVNQAWALFEIEFQYNITTTNP
jgi:hypothetical protein